MILLVGPLAHPAMLRALQVKGDVQTIRGRLLGGSRAGIDLDGWPVIQNKSDADEGARIPAVAAEWTPRLRRYAEITGLEPAYLGGQQLLGVQDHGAGSDASKQFSTDHWPADFAVAIALWVLDQLDGHTPAQIRQRWPRIGDWVGAQQRAAQSTASQKGQGAELGPEGDERFEILLRCEAYANFFAVEELSLRHRLYGGGWSKPLLRAAFVSGDATVVLPWDPIRDRVLLIDQFRAGPAARGDHQPWLFEAVAGRLDQDEDPQVAARREAREEAGVELRDLIAGPHHYPSSGATAEFIYLYIGIADLPDGITGIGGLEDEDEDIRSHLISRQALLEMVRNGEIRNGPLLVLALWLDREAEGLRSKYTPV